MVSQQVASMGILDGFLHGRHIENMCMASVRPHEIMGRPGLQLSKELKWCPSPVLIKAALSALRYYHPNR